MSLTVPKAHQTLDLTGVRCPNLLLSTMRKLRTMDTDQILCVIATDLNAPSSLTSWSRQSDNDLIEMYEENGRFVFYLRCNPTPINHLTTKGS